MVQTSLLISLCDSLIETYHIKTCYKENLPIFAEVSVAEQAGLGMTSSETPKTGLLALWPIQ